MPLISYCIPPMWHKHRLSSTYGVCHIMSAHSTVAQLHFQFIRLATIFQSLNLKLKRGFVLKLYIVLFSHML